MSHACRRVLLLFIMAAGAGLGCSSASPPTSEQSGGFGGGSGGGSGGSTGGSATAGATSGKAATGGAVATGGGTGGNVAGTGGSGSGGGVGTGGGAGAHEPSTGGAGGRVGGAGGSAGAGATTGGNSGNGGKPNQGSLPAITLHMAGDSTMANYAATTTQEGWGQEIGQFFISKVTIDNQAQGGANIQTFYSGRWKTLINDVKPGDYVMAAFGINDSGTTHGPVSSQDFQAQMETMAEEVAAKSATFIPTTSSPLQAWTNGQETNARLQPYCDATKAVGTHKGLLVDDLNARGIGYYNMIGEAAAGTLTFNGDKAHFNKQGATEMARLASQDLMRINSPLAAYLK